MEGLALPLAWQPVTAGGVAAFAHARLGRLLVVQFVMALLAASVAAWFVHRAWFPVVSAAIEQLPAQGEIRAGRLSWGGTGPQLLGEGRYLAVAVDLNHEGTVRSPANVALEFGGGDARIFSLFGFVRWPYPKGWIMPFNRVELKPWWGAWAPPLLAITMVLIILALMLSWSVLATVYYLPVWLIGFFANRDLDLRASWRLAGAALMPGALLLTAALVLYGLGVLDLLHLTIALAVHFVVGWVYLVLAPLRLPRHPQAPAQGDPFTGSTKANAS